VIAVRCLFAFLLLLAAPAWANSPESVDIPFKDGTVLKGWLLRPEGKGPFPVAIISHGSPANPAERVNMTAKFTAASEQFVRWGFIVLNPIRRGYGATGGPWMEGYGTCNNPDFLKAGMTGAEEIAAAVRHVATLPGADAERVLLVGQSAGGWASLAAIADKNIKVHAAVNFAGGRGGMRDGRPNYNCSPDALVTAAGRFGAAARQPSLWLYTSNDKFFAPELSTRMYEAYRGAGGNARLVPLPDFGKDGHSLFGAQTGVPVWAPHVQTFLKDQKLIRTP
jgi:dienelactone hydrolase